MRTTKLPTDDKISDGNSTVNVCVIIPCYNNADTIFQAIQSVLTQDYKNLNMVIVDDGSTDSTYASVRQLLTDIKTDTLDNDEESFTVGLIGSIPTILISHEKHEGAAITKNKGIMAGWQTAKYFTVLDADGSFLPSKISKCVAILQDDTNVGIVYHNLTVIIDNGSYIEYLPPYDRDIIEESPISLNGACMPKSTLEALGIFETSLTEYEDWDLCLRITERYMAIHIPEVLGSCRTHNQHNGETIALIHERVKARKV